MLFLKGIIIGFCVAAPIGPVGLLCIRRTLQSGVWAGLTSGLGAACADTLFAAMTVLGVFIVADMLRDYDATIRIIGGGLLIAIALRAFFAKASSETSLNGKAVASHFISSFFLTISNPATFIGLAALFAGLGIAASSDLHQAMAFIIGVFIGSMLWWSILSSMVTKMRSSRLFERAETINRYLAALLGLIGVWAIFTALVS